jgi:hypothetical protein
VELIDEIRRISEIAGRLPRVIGWRVILPLNFIKETATAESRIEDFFDFPLQFVVNDNGRRRILGSIRDSRRFVRIQEEDVEHRVNLHRRWELQAVGLEANPLFDNVGAKVLPVEFLRGTLSSDIRREKPNFIPDGEFDAFVLGVVIACLGVLGGFDVLDEGVVVSLELFGVLLGGRILRVEVDAKVNAELEIVTVGGKEWRTFNRGLKSIIVSELSEGQ